MITLVWYIYSTTFTGLLINQIKVWCWYVAVRNREKAGINTTYDAGHNSPIFEL